MIPYFQYNAFLIGPVTIQVWGLMVSIGIIAAVAVMHWLAKRQFLSTELMMDMAVWAVVGGFIGGRLGHVLFYQPAYYFAHPLQIIAFWRGGASSIGGFIGAGAAIWIFCRKRKLTLEKLWPYFDIAALSLWLGWGIGRIGCFLIHDHPGTLTHFILATRYPGGARHDLGLYESILGFALFLVFGLSYQYLTKRRSGLAAQLSWLCYAVVRFFLDFLRASDLPVSDARYLWFTPAQWGMIALAGALTFSLVKGRMTGKKINRRSDI